MILEESYGAVVFRNDGALRYLLVFHASGHWDFPKGHPEKGESPFQTTRREVLEEACCYIHFVPGFQKEIRYTIEPDRKRKVTFFLAEWLATDTSKVPTKDIHQSKWLSYREARNALSYANSISVLDAAHEELTQENPRP